MPNITTNHAITFTYYYFLEEFLLPGLASHGNYIVIISPRKSLKIKVMFDRLHTADVEARTT